MTCWATIVPIEWATNDACSMLESSRIATTSSAHPAIEVSFASGLMP